MRIFAIKNDELDDNPTLGYLIYYENPKSFYIELPDNADPWETPLLLSSFLKKGEHSVNSYWSRIWVQQRIIPPDRQNISQVLNDNHLARYDEFSLLMLSMGRCEQDGCYLIELQDVPDIVSQRWAYKIEDVVPLEQKRLLIFFRNGDVRIVDMSSFENDDPLLAPHLQNRTRFDKVEVQPDGYGIMWNEHAVVSDRILYARGEPVPLSLADFCSFIRNRVINASEAAAILDCSRQNIDDLMRRDKIHPIRKDAKYKLFLKNEILQRRKK